jgi:hypothetical protein
MPGRSTDHGTGSPSSISGAIGIAFLRNSRSSQFIRSSLFGHFE